MSESPIRPPVAAKKPHSVTHHGITVTDDYAWLRDPGYPEVSDPEILDHLKAENAWFEHRMAGQQGRIDALFKEMRARIKEADKSVPQKDGDYLYWIEFEEGAEYKKWWRRPVAGGPDQLILDEVALAEGHEYFRLGAIDISRDGRILAWSELALAVCALAIVLMPFFEGIVVKGNQLGRTIGYPTANLQLTDNEKLIPGNGVYAVHVRRKHPISGELFYYGGMMNIGVRPTVDGLTRVIEVHIFDFTEDIYGECLQVTLIAWLRAEKKFEGLPALVAQLRLDEETAKAALSH